MRSMTVLVDNAALPGYAQEHGFACWIQWNGLRVLFDTGHGEALFANAARAGIDLTQADALVLSHGHYDHTGNVARLLALRPDLPVHAHPGVLQERFSCRRGAACSIGLPAAARKSLQEATVHWVDAPRELGAGVGLLGPVPRRTAFEDTGGPFFLDPAGRQPDPILDDLSMWLEAPGGVVLLTGCCHAGIVNTLAMLQEIRPQRPLLAVLGGLHLLDAMAERVAHTIAALAHAGMGATHPRLLPCHCTGAEASQSLRRAFPGAWSAGGAGTVLTW